MRIDIKDEKNEPSSVTVRSVGDEVHLLFTHGDRHTCWSMTPAEAVALWRCFMGENDKAMIGGRRLAWIEDGLDKWRIFLGDGIITDIDPDEGLALAWAIERSVAKVLEWSEPKKEPKREPRALTPEDLACTVPAEPRGNGQEHVWILTAVTVPRHLAATQCASAFTKITSKSFSSYEKAMDCLREFIRPFLNDAEEDIYWDGNGMTIDDVLDKIIDKNYGGRWRYDGFKFSFVVSIEHSVVDL